MKSFLKENYLLILILLVAIALRFYKLSTIPIGFNDDEAAFGYNAYSIIKTLKDEWGRLLPFPSFESFGDWKLVLYLYLVAAFQLIFGLSELSTRFPSALFGVLAVVATYLFTKELFKAQEGNRAKAIATTAAFLIAISPWQIVASRNAFESDLLSFFILLGAFFFLKGLRDHKFLTASTIIFVLAFYTYRSSWLFVPLFVLALAYLYRNQLAKAEKVLARNVLLAAVLLLPLAPTVLTFKGQSRFIQESFIKGVARTGITNDINENRGQCRAKLPDLICPVIYNKLNSFVTTYTANYFGNLSYKTYFEQANPTGFQSFATRPVFHLFELPFLIFGLILILKAKEPTPKILLAWILLAPIGAAMAGVGNYGRLNLIMPAPQIVAAFGLVKILQMIKSQNIANLAKVAIFGIAFASLLKLTVDIFVIEPYQTSRYQRYGYKQLFSYLDSQITYDQVYISQKIDNSHQYIHYLYFQKVDPEFYLSNVVRYRGEDGWIVFEKVGRYNFLPSVPGLETFPAKSLLVVGEKEVSFPAAPITGFSDLRGDLLFEVYDVDQVKEELKKQHET